MPLLLSLLATARAGLTPVHGLTERVCSCENPGFISIYDQTDAVKRRFKRLVA